MSDCTVSGKLLRCSWSVWAQTFTFRLCEKKNRILGSIVSHVAAPTAGCRTSREMCTIWGVLGSIVLFEVQKKKKNVKKKI